MKNKTQDPRVYFGLAGLTLFGGVGFVFMQNKSLGSLRTKVGQLSEQEREQKQLYLKLTDTQKDLDVLKTKLAHLEAGVPDSAYLPTMLQELETAGKEHHILINGVRPMQVKGPTYGKAAADPYADKPYQPLDFELKGKGLYSDFVAFVKSLDTFPKVVAVRTISVAPPVMGPKGADKRLDVTLGLRAFVFKQSADKNDDANAAKPATAAPGASSPASTVQGPHVAAAAGTVPGAKLSPLNAPPTSGIPVGARAAVSVKTTRVAPPTGGPKGRPVPVAPAHMPGAGAVSTVHNTAAAANAAQAKALGGRP